MHLHHRTRDTVDGIVAIASHKDVARAVLNRHVPQGPKLCLWRAWTGADKVHDVKERRAKPGLLQQAGQPCTWDRWTGVPPYVVGGDDEPRPPSVVTEYTGAWGGLPPRVIGILNEE